MKPDRRIARTRRLLRNAILELIIEKGYAAISVQDLIDRANVARSTFYKHFRGMDDLLLQGFREISPTQTDKLFSEDVHETKEYPDFGNALFQGAENYKDMARALLGKGSDNLVVQHLRNMLVVQVREWLEMHLPQTKLGADKLEFAVQFVVGALVSTLLWWVQNDFPQPAADINAAFNEMTKQGLNGFAPRTPLVPIPAR